MRLSSFYLCLISVLIISLLLSRLFFTEEFMIKLFLYSFFIHLVGTLYMICSFLEINVLHEEQGSKLNLSKSKLTHK